MKNFLNQNYITKTIDKNNKREKLIRFTKKGKAYATEIMDELNQFEQKIFSKLNSDERKTLVQINRILVNNLDKELKREKEQNYK